MAVTKTLTEAIPYNLDSKVQQWDFTMQYEEGADATYYTSNMSTSIPATAVDGTVNFTPKAEGLWTLAELTALCPISQWDAVFASQYASMVPPPVEPVPDNSYVIPS
tara:strand:- start:296 stop:616 length:321 start_codon:yes stop_codon:yes gene_type:complete